MIGLVLTILVVLAFCVVSGCLTQLFGSVIRLLGSKNKSSADNFDSSSTKENFSKQDLRYARIKYFTQQQLGRIHERLKTLREAGVTKPLDLEAALLDNR